MVLIIAEKPSVAEGIAKVVGAAKKERGFFSGNGYLVSWCFGHLIELATPQQYDAAYEKWALDLLPIIPEKFQTQVTASKADQFSILKELMHRQDVTELVEATDAGREGELIFRLVYEKAGCKKSFKRLWISSMEEEVIKEGLASMKDGSEYDSLYQAALCRQRADWLLGINLTRLYTSMYRKKLTVGRVQTPTVNLVVQRQREIENFVPQPYWTISADLGGFKAYTKKEDKQSAEDIVANCSGSAAQVVSVKQESKKSAPPKLYDLTSLQRDANRLLGYTAQQTLDYLQSLYEKKLCTYPRTDSQFITAAQEPSTAALVSALLSSDILPQHVASGYNEANVSISRTVNDAKVSDHHAILPTLQVNKDSLNSVLAGERRLLLLVIYRLLAAVYPPQLYATVAVSFDINGEEFKAKGKTIIDNGYKTIESAMRYAVKAEEETTDEKETDEPLPPLEEGTMLQVISVKSEEKKTRPKPPYTEDTLLAAMETAGKEVSDPELKEAMKDRGLGTPATRAKVIENIVATGYIQREGKKLRPTEAACTFIDLVTDKVKEPELTASWERQLSEIHRGQRDPNAFLAEICSFVSSFVEETVALHNPDTTKALFTRERESLGVCPRCGQAVVEYPKSYSCNSGKDGCGFAIWKTIAGKAISKKQAEKLISKGRSDLIKGFTSKSGKSFEAYLILRQDKSVGFDFPAK